MCSRRGSLRAAALMRAWHANRIVSGGSAMWPETSRAGAAVVLAGLTAVLLVKGILPAMSGLNTDFPNYLTAAKIVADGGPAERLYDIPWFQEQMRRYRIGNPSEGKFAPFPPPTALLLVPLARLAPLDALR